MNADVMPTEKETKERKDEKTIVLEFNPFKNPLKFGKGELTQKQIIKRLKTLPSLEEKVKELLYIGLLNCSVNKEKKVICQAGRKRSIYDLMALAVGYNLTKDIKELLKTMQKIIATHSSMYCMGTQTIVIRPTKIFVGSNGYWDEFNYGYLWAKLFNKEIRKLFSNETITPSYQMFKHLSLKNKTLYVNQFIKLDIDKYTVKLLNNIKFTKTASYGPVTIEKKKVEEIENKLREKFNFYDNL